MLRDDEVVRRVQALTRLFTGPDAGLPVAPCRNVDRRWNAFFIELIGEVPPAPSIEHTIVQCHACAEDIWIGPRQKELPAIRICYVCHVVNVANSIRRAGRTVVLNQGAEPIPRTGTEEAPQ